MIEFLTIVAIVSFVLLIVFILCALVMVTINAVECRDYPTALAFGALTMFIVCMVSTFILEGLKG